jgi:hypothetical protein
MDTLYENLMANGRVVRVAAIVRLLVQRGCVLGLLVDGTTLVVFRKEFLDFPVVLLDADGEFEIFAGNRVPVLFLDWLADARLLISVGRLTLYTIMTARRLQMVAKKRPSR